MARSLFLHALLLASALVAAVPVTHEVHEKRVTLHKRWSKRDRVPSHMLLPVRIGLVQNVDVAKAESHLMEVYVNARTP
jgi:tripeptidyl-peptidase I